MTKKAVSNRRVILTGGPGAGKTTLLTALAGRGYACMHDSARAIIQDRLCRGLSARPDPAEFATATLRMDIERYRQVPTEADLVFFDRAIPEAFCRWRRPDKPFWTFHFSAKFSWRRPKKRSTRPTANATNDSPSPSACIAA